MSRLSNTVSIGLPLDLKPWQKIDWNGCMQSRLFTDWGKYYTRRLLHKKALECYGRALIICEEEAMQAQPNTCTVPNPQQPPSVRKCFIPEQNICRNEYKTLFRRGQCERSIARSELAWLNLRQAQDLMQRNKSQGLEDQHRIILEQCDALYDCNQFEQNLSSLHNAAHQFEAPSIKNHFKLRIDRTLAVFEDTLGERLSPFFQQNRAVVSEVAQRHEKRATFKPRPLWKALQESKECDVQSVLDKQHISLTPLERARRRVHGNVYNYTYLGRSGKDVAFLRDLRHDRNFLNPLLPETTPILRELINDQNTIVSKFMRIMHARNPLYNRTQLKCRGTGICEKNRKNYLYRVEYQTRRDCYRILREVRQLRRERNIERLTDYVEHIMANYVVLKTHRTLPWKFEFVNDVYNMLALAHIDRCAVPANVDLLNPKNRSLLYLLPAERVKDNTVSFGGANVYNEIDRNEERHSRVNWLEVSTTRHKVYSLKLERLEDRLRHSLYPIERAYLLFEMARSHFKESRFDKCMITARKAVYEARSCNSVIWRFNSTFLVCQVHAVLNRHERLKESVAKARQLAESLKSDKLLAYLAICSTVNDHELALRRLRYADLYVRRQQRKRSNPSSLTSLSSDPTSYQTSAIPSPAVTPATLVTPKLTAMQI